MGIRISEMEEAASFGEEDLIPIVSNGSNKKALGSKIKDFIAGFFVSKSGDTMTGKLTLGAAPSENMDAATKKYVDDADATKANRDASNVTDGAAWRTAIGAASIPSYRFTQPSIKVTLPSGNSLECDVYQLGDLVIVNLVGYLKNDYIPTGGTALFEGLPKIRDMSQIFAISSKGRFRLFNSGNESIISIQEATNITTFIGTCFTYIKTG